MGSLPVVSNKMTVSVTVIRVTLASMAPGGLRDEKTVIQWVGVGRSVGRVGSGQGEVGDVGKG